ncbi:PLDc N-terminal domain-containing protein [Salinimicrobium catena]
MEDLRSFLWFLLVVFAPVIGTIIYLLLGRKTKMR